MREIDMNSCAKSTSEPICRAIHPTCAIMPTSHCAVADSAPRLPHARHLVWLRDQLGDRFKAGALLHSGPARFPLDDRIQAIPICALWS